MPGANTLALCLAVKTHCNPAKAPKGIAEAFVFLAAPKASQPAVKDSNPELCQGSGFWTRAPLCCTGGGHQSHPAIQQTQVGARLCRGPGSVICGSRAAHPALPRETPPLTPVPHFRQKSPSCLSSRLLPKILASLLALSCLL